MQRHKQDTGRSISQVEVDMSQALKSQNGTSAIDSAAAELSNAVRQADISESIMVEDQDQGQLPDLSYDEAEKKRQRTWRAHMRRRREFEARKIDRASEEGQTAAASSSFQSLAESVRQTVVVALLAQEGDPRTKIGHWRVKDVGGVKQACFKNQIASELCYNIALGVHYLLQKDPPAHEPDPFSYAIDVPSLGDKDSGILPTYVPDFSFKVYKPNVFRRLRGQFGISETDFRNSLEATQQVPRALPEPHRYYILSLAAGAACRPTCVRCISCALTCFFSWDDHGTRTVDWQPWRERLLAVQNCRRLVHYQDP